MYTNDGILQVISTRDASVNLLHTRLLLDAVEAGGLVISEAHFEALVRWKEDIKSHFIRRAELLGVTNVANKGMGPPQTTPHY